MSDPTPTLKDYQESDFNEFMSRYRRGDTACICEWEPGLGKTLLSIMLWRALGLPRMLVSCPSIALVSWIKETAKWCPSAKVLIVAAGKDVKKLRPDHDIVVITHDLARNDDLRAAVREWARGAFAVIDEAQYLRSHDSQRTGAAYGRGEGTMTYVEKILLLSGTLIVSWPDDLWPHLARWMPERIMMDGQRMGYEQFRDYFLMTRRVPIPGAFIHRIQKFGMTDERKVELRQRLTGWSIRRVKAEAGLPPLTWHMMPLELTAKDRKAIDSALMDHLPARMHPLLKAASANPGDAEIAQRLEDALGEYTELMPVAMRILGVGKAKALSRVLKDKLDNTPQTHAIGVFSLNRAVMDVFDADLSKFGVLRIDGSTPRTARTKVVDSFMQDRGPRVFNGQIVACGTALTLTRANQCYMPQMSWIPGENFQAVSRFHRIGQHNPVDAYIPVVPGTLDMPLMAVLRKKTQAAEAMHGA